MAEHVPGKHFRKGLSLPQVFKLFGHPLQFTGYDVAFDGDTHALKRILEERRI